MIAHLKGRLDSTGTDHAVIDVGGVGYFVGRIVSRTLAAIGPVGEACTLFTEMLVAEDFIRLVGFARADERDWFRSADRRARASVRGSRLRSCRRSSRSTSAARSRRRTRRWSHALTASDQSWPSGSSAS